MTQLPKLTARDRLLILAPHPDDECLATGGLIQRAVAAHARVRVLFATDGENNPWPQRVVERKWRIHPEDRARWGARRRREALLSLEYLGVPANSVRFLGLPDQGITGMLLTGDERPLKMIGAALREWQPTLIVFPCSTDVHPDHSSLHVFMNLAIDLVRLSPSSFSILHFVVHARGRHTPPHRVQIILSPGEKARKRGAILCHGSQMALSKRRFVAYAKDAEIYFRPAKVASTDAHHPVRHATIENGALNLKLHVHRTPLKGVQLCVVAESAESGSIRWALPVPPASRRVHVRDADTGELLRLATVRVKGRDVEVNLPVSSLMPLERLFVKIERRVVFFDEAGWREVPLPDREGARKEGTQMNSPRPRTPR